METIQENMKWKLLRSGLDYKYIIPLIKRNNLAYKTNMLCINIKFVRFVEARILPIL